MGIDKPRGHNDVGYSPMTPAEILPTHGCKQSDSSDVEERSQKNRANLLAILDNLPFLAWLKDSEGRFIAVNEPFARASGHSSPADMIGKTDLDIWPRHLAEAYRADDSEVMASRKKKGVEELVRDQGADKWFETFKAPLFDTDGNVTGTTGFARDITERKQHEQVLRESEERWQFALEGSEDGVWDWDAQSNEVFFSRRWKEMLGYEEHEIGNTLDEWDKRIHPEDKEQVYKKIEEHFAGQNSVYMSEHRVLCKDGAYKWILDRGKVMSRTEDGKPLRVVGTHTDISRQKRMEKALQESGEKFSTVFQLNPSPMVISSADEGRYVEVNDAFLKTLEFEKDEAIGRTSKELGVFEEPEQRDALLKIIGERGRLKDCEVIFRTKTGKRLYGIASGGFIQLQGQQYLLTVVNDVTQRRQAEEEKERLILELKLALSKIKTLSGLLPICASCKKIRNDEGYWEQIEIYIKDRSEADFSHGICPECARKYYGEFYKGK